MLMLMLMLHLPLPHLKAFLLVTLMTNPKWQSLWAKCPTLIHAAKLSTCTDVHVIIQLGGFITVTPSPNHYQSLGYVPNAAAFMY